jgi:flagellar motility protein MotE (MotC chaperone)
MKNGYDQFFKNAKKVAGDPRAIERQPTKSRASVATTEDLVKKLREKQSTKMKTKKQGRIPWKLVGFSILGLLLTAVGYQRIEEIERGLSKIEIGLFGQAYAEQAPATAKEATTSGNSEAAQSPTASAAQNVEVASEKKKYTEEELNHLGKLNQRKSELDAREEELNKIEQELAAQKELVEKKIAELEGTRKNISSMLEDRVKADEQKIDNLVQVYSTMRPPQAAKALEEMDENLAIEIIGRMKKKNAAEIMNLVKPEKVKVFSEKYAGYKQK